MGRFILPALVLVAFIGYFAWRDWGVTIDSENDNHCAAVGNAFISVFDQEGRREEGYSFAPMSNFLRERALEASDADAKTKAEFERLRQAVLDDPRLYNAALEQCTDRALADPEFQQYMRKGISEARERFEELKRTMEPAVEQ